MKIKNFLKPKGQCNYPTLHHDNKVAKTNADEVQLFAESVKRHFSIEREHVDSNHFNEVNQFIGYIKLGYIPTTWKIANLCMLLKPDKLPSLTTSYRPISLISSIMKLFERVIEQRLCSYPEQIGFINKHQSGFKRAKSTNDHLLKLSQSIMESFNKGEHVVAAFLDI